MWCKDNNCCHYDAENDRCTRVDKDGTVGVCWLNLVYNRIMEAIKEIHKMRGENDD